MPDNVFAGLTEEEEAAIQPDAYGPEPEPAPEPEKAPEPEAAEEAPKEPEKEEGKPPEGYVPHGALHAERERRKALEAELSEFREWRKGVETKLNPPKPEPEMPDPVTQPTEFRQWQMDQLRQRDERFSAYERQTQEQQQFQSAMTTAAQQEASFREQAPDYDQAINYLAEARGKELAYFGLPPEQIQQTIAQEARGIVTEALRSGRNVAEVAYGIAQARGYRAAQREQPAPQANAAEESARLQKIAEASRSVGAAPGGGGGQDLTLEDVANMAPEEIASLPERVRRRIMGG